MNKAFIALLWIASALLTYWLGLEQGSDSAYTGDGNQSVPGDSSSMVQKRRKTSTAGPVSFLLSVYLRETLSQLRWLTSRPCSDQERICESQSSDLQERIKSSNPVVRLGIY